MKVTFNVESLLLVILLLAGIVAVIFAIVLICKLIGTVNRANAILDESTLVVHDAKKQVENAFASAKSTGTKLSATAQTGFKAAMHVAEKFPNIKSDRHKRR